MRCFREQLGFLFSYFFVFMRWGVVFCSFCVLLAFCHSLFLRPPILLCIHGLCTLSMIYYSSSSCLNFDYWIFDFCNFVSCRHIWYGIDINMKKKKKKKKGTKEVRSLRLSSSHAFYEESARVMSLCGDVRPLFSLSFARQYCKSQL